MAWPARIIAKRPTAVGSTQPLPKRKRRVASGTVATQQANLPRQCSITKPHATSQGMRLEIPTSISLAVKSWVPDTVKWFRDRAQQHALKPLPFDMVLKIGTDCSGLEAPVHAMKAMGFRLEQVFSSETVGWKREYLRLNLAPQTQIFKDMLRRDHGSLPSCDIYCCGFSCKPFSTLHTRSRMFKEKEAKVFFGAVNTIRATLPPVAVLENVRGIRKVMSRVLQTLKGLGAYNIVVCDIDPRDAGEPVSRPRVYFVLVRSDVSTVSGDRLRAVAADILSCRFGKAAATLESRLLPEGCGLLSRFDVGAAATRRWAKQARRGIEGCQEKWHKTIGSSPRVPIIPPISGIGPRATAMLEAMLANLRMHRLPGKNIDVSQSMGRCRFTEFVPTITPGAKIVIGCRHRTLSPIEMLLLSGIPVGELMWPSSFKAHNFADMAGNTMHCMAVCSLFS